MLRKFSGELADIYGRLERTEIKNLEEHLSKLSYKIAVELAQVNLLMASLLEVPYADTQKLRGKAVKLVNQSRGYVPLKDALHNTVELHYFEDQYDEDELERIVYGQRKNNCKALFRDRNSRRLRNCRGNTRGRGKRKICTMLR